LCSAPCFLVGFTDSLASGAGQPLNLKKDVHYKTTAEGALHLDLYYPEKDLTGEYPVVIYTHGGGWAAGDKRGAWQAKKGDVSHGLTRKGFCVVAVQYRLWKKGGSTTMRDCVIDAKDAIRFLSKNRKTLHVNTDQVFTFGDSAGGQMAQMLLLSPPKSLPGDDALAGFTYRTIAGVSWYGPCDFEKTELFNHDGRPNFRDRFGPRILKPDTNPTDKLALYREMSPINLLKKDSPPLLMIQGDGDTTIPVHHAHHMQKKAKAIDALVEILIIKNAGHNWRKADGKTPIEPSMNVIVERSIDFISKHLKKHQPNKGGQE
jgi:acetyl esterase/lipase